MGYRYALIIFNNHWKSKLGGAEETEFQRLEVAALIAGKLREIHLEQPYADIVVLGDLNENVVEYRPCLRIFRPSAASS
ncbi:MAG TPA: hypothetical protein ENH82_05865 [bacterium]|nr:hypothetical protein [bacterium]